MGACASSSRGRSNQGKNQNSAKVAALPSSSPASETAVQVQHQAKGKYCPPAAASAASEVEVEEKSSFKWRIDGMSSLLAKDKGWTNSGYFEIKGLKWYLRLKLKDRKSGDVRDYVSLVLKLSKKSHLKPDIVVVKASFKLLIYDQAYGKHSEHECSHHFQIEDDSRSESGVSCMIPVNTLTNPSSGFVVGDSCVFAVELIDIDHLTTSVASNNTSETGCVQKINNLNVREREAYTWIVDDFLALKDRCYSPEFEIGGHKWYLSMYPSGFNNGGEFLSLYLYMAKPDASLHCTGVQVELRLSIKDKVTANRNTLTGRCQFSATGDDQGDGWGWANFMSLKRLKEWFLVKGSCLIEADVSIIASRSTPKIG